MLAKQSEVSTPGPGPLQTASTYPQATDPITLLGHSLPVGHVDQLEKLPRLLNKSMAR